MSNENSRCDVCFAPLVDGICQDNPDHEPLPRHVRLPANPLADAIAKGTFLPSDAKARKALPIATGCLDYFPKALAAVAEVSRVGNEQHNPGKPLRWDRTKSTDEADCLMRHFLERGTMDKDRIRHSAKVAWRALALLEKEIEAEVQVVNDFMAHIDKDRNTA
jgi:hypothetical protein